MSNTSNAKDFSYIFNIVEGTREQVNHVVTERNFVMLVNEVLQILTEENNSLRTENDMLRERLNLAAISDYRISEKHRRILLSQGLSEDQLCVPSLIKIVAQYARNFAEVESKNSDQVATPLPDQAPPAPSGIPIVPQQRQILASFIERYNNPTSKMTSSTTSIVTAAEVSHTFGIHQLPKTNKQLEIIHPSKKSRLSEINCVGDVNCDLRLEKIHPGRNSRQSEINCAGDINHDLQLEDMRPSKTSNKPEVNCTADVNRNLRLEPLPAADIRPFKRVSRAENHLHGGSLEHTSNGHGNALFKRRPQSPRSPTWNVLSSRKLPWESDSDEMNDERKQMRSHPPRSTSKNSRQRGHMLDNCPNEKIRCEYFRCQRLGYHTDECKIQMRYKSPTD